MPRASAVPTGAFTIRSQIRVTAIAIPMTAGTKTPEMVSAILAMGAFVAAASLTIWMTWDRLVSSPTRVA